MQIGVADSEYAPFPQDAMTFMQGMTTVCKGKVFKKVFAEYDFQRRICKRQRFAIAENYVEVRTRISIGVDPTRFSMLTTSHVQANRCLLTLGDGGQWT